MRSCFHSVAIAASRSLLSRAAREAALFPSRMVDTASTVNWRQQLSSDLKNKKIIRKKGLNKSARSLLRDYSDDALNSFKFGKSLEHFGDILGKTLLFIDIGSTIYNNYTSNKVKST